MKALLALMAKVIRKMGNRAGQGRSDVLRTVEWPALEGFVWENGL